MKPYSFLQEDCVGQFHSGKTFYIDVYKNDPGNIPHFHFYDIDKKINLCIQIADNKYFEHDKYKGSITDSKTRKLLDKFLRQKPTNSKYKNKFQNNWYVIKFLWNLGNSNMKIADSCTIKDYTTIKPYKESK